MNQLKASEILITQILDLLFEDDVLDTAITVHERDVCCVIRFQQRGQNRQDRRDSAARREQQHIAWLFAFRRVFKMPIGWQHVDGCTCLQQRMRPLRKHAVIYPLDGHSPLTVMRCRAERVRAAQLLISDFGTQGDILAGLKSEGVFVRL